MQYKSRGNRKGASAFLLFAEGSRKEAKTQSKNRMLSDEHIGTMIQVPVFEPEQDPVAELINARTRRRKDAMRRPESLFHFSAFVLGVFA